MTSAFFFFLSKHGDITTAQYCFFSGVSRQRPLLARNVLSTVLTYFSFLAGRVLCEEIEEFVSTSTVVLENRNVCFCDVR